MGLLAEQHELAATCCMALLTAAFLCSSSGWQLACACMLKAKSFLNSAFHPLPSLVMHFRDKMTLALNLMYKIAKQCIVENVGMLEPAGLWFVGSTAPGHLLGTFPGPQGLRAHRTCVGHISPQVQSLPGAGGEAPAGTLHAGCSQLLCPECWGISSMPQGFRLPLALLLSSFCCNTPWLGCKQSCIWPDRYCFTALTVA